MGTPLLGKSLGMTHSMHSVRGVVLQTCVYGHIASRWTGDVLRRYHADVGCVPGLFKASPNSSGVLWCRDMACTGGHRCGIQKSANIASPPLGMRCGLRGGWQGAWDAAVHAFVGRGSGRWLTGHCIEAHLVPLWCSGQRPCMGKDRRSCCPFGTRVPEAGHSAVCGRLLLPRKARASCQACCRPGPLGVPLCGRPYAMKHALGCFARLVRLLLGPTALADQKMEFGLQIGILGVEMRLSSAGFQCCPSKDKVCLACVVGAGAARTCMTCADPGSKIDFCHSAGA